MIKTKFDRRSLMLLTLLVVGAFLGTSVGAAVFVEGQEGTLSASETGTVVIEAAYVIFKDTAGYTCAKNTTTQAIEFKDTNAKLIIQKAIDRASFGNVWIRAGTYDISATIYSWSTSITGDGNGTILKATSGLKGAVLRVSNEYYKADGTLVMPKAIVAENRPNGVTISNMQIDGNKAVRANGDGMVGIGFIDVTNCHIRGVYAHDIINGQGFYMTNSHYCTIRDCSTYNIGDDLLVNYGSGIAFGEASQTKVASSHILIDNVKIVKSSMSAIDLEPANNITITNCQFLGAATYNGYPTPVITMYALKGYLPNDNIMISGNHVYGAFSEFVILTPSNYSIITNNIVTYTASNAIAIYSTSSHDNKITGNIINTVSKDAFAALNCNSCLVSDNTFTDIMTSKNDYGIRFLATTGTSYYNVVRGNQITGFQYAICEVTGTNHIVVTGNVIKSCTVGTYLKGTDIYRSGNILNGASEL